MQRNPPYETKVTLANLRLGRYYKCENINNAGIETEGVSNETG
jgi:hypothetical protein